MFRGGREAVVEGPVLAVELIGTVLWMAWEIIEMAQERDLEGKGRGNKGAGCSRVGSKAPGEGVKEAAAMAAAGGSNSSRRECSLGDSE